MKRVNWDKLSMTEKKDMIHECNGGNYNWYTTSRDKKLRDWMDTHSPFELAVTRTGGLRMDSCYSGPLFKKNGRYVPWVMVKGTKEQKAAFLKAMKVKRVLPKGGFSLYIEDTSKW